MAAEQVIYGVITTGAENDLEQVTMIARGMVGRWGMSSKVGPLTILPGRRRPAAGRARDTLATVDKEVRRIVDECYERAVRVLGDNRDKLDGIVAALLEHETLDEHSAYAAAGLLGAEQAEPWRRASVRPDIGTGGAGHVSLNDIRGDLP